MISCAWNPQHPQCPQAMARKHQHVGWMLRDELRLLWSGTNTAQSPWAPHTDHEVHLSTGHIECCKVAGRAGEVMTLAHQTGRGRHTCSMCAGGALALPPPARVSHHPMCSAPFRMSHTTVVGTLQPCLKLHWAEARILQSVTSHMTNNYSRIQSCWQGRTPLKRASLALASARPPLPSISQAPRCTEAAVKSGHSKAEVSGNPFLVTSMY
jgi:hypothetical protein